MEYHRPDKRNPNRFFVGPQQCVHLRLAKRWVLTWAQKVQKPKPKDKGDLSLTLILKELRPCRRLAKDVGVTLPMMSNKHAYVVTDVVEELKNHGYIPNLRSGVPVVCYLSTQI